MQKEEEGGKEKRDTSNEKTVEEWLRMSRCYHI